MTKLVGTMAALSAGIVAAHVAWVAMATEPETGAPVVTAASLTGAPHRIIQVADLNLAHPAGVATLENRIRGAVRAVCGRANHVRETDQLRAIRECRAASYADAMAQAEDRMASIRVAAR